jgi:hypothetical protein
LTYIPIKDLTEIIDNNLIMENTMKTKTYLGIFCGLLLGVVILYSFNTPQKVEAGGSDTQSLIEKGRYLTTIGGCHDCHTPKIFGPEGMAFDMDRQYMGHPAEDKLPPVPDGVLGMEGWGFLGNHHLTGFAGPWGLSFAANLTPDEETGIGSWTEEMFIKAMRTGQHMGEGRPILPPMPWFNLAEAKDEDLKAMFAYFKSLPPIYNPVPEPVPPAK